MVTSIKMYKLSSFCLVLIALCQLLGVKHANAVATQNFPNPSHSTNGTPTAAVGIYGSQGGGSSELQSPRSEFEIRVDNPGRVDITIVDACYTGSSAGRPGGGYYSMDVSISGAGVTSVTKDNGQGWIDRTQGDCNTSNGNITFNNVNMTSTTMSVIVRKIGGPGIKAFKVSVDKSSPSTADNPTVSYDADASRYSPGVPPGSTNGFALFGSGTVEFKFQLPCNYRNTDSLWMKWFDADDGTPGIQDNSLYWSLVDEATGQVAVDYSLGGDNTFGQHEVTGLEAGHKYVWRWHNVDGVNGVQLWMPFSENTYSHQASCVTVSATINFTCDRVYGHIRDTADPNRQLQYKIFIRQTGPTSSYISQGGLPTTQANVGSGNAYSDNIDGDTIFGDGTNNRYFMIRVYNSGGTQIADLEGSSLGGEGSPHREPCTTPGPGSGSLGACDKTLTWTMPTDGVKVRVYAIDSGGTEHEVYNANRNTTASFDTGSFTSTNAPHKVGFDNLLSNNGFRVLIKPVDTNGDPVGPNKNEPANGYIDDSTGTCFDVTCRINIQPVAGLPANGVKAGVDFEYTFTIINKRTGVVQRKLDGSNLGLTHSGGDFSFTAYSLGKNVPSGNGAESTSGTLRFTAPNDRASIRTIKGYPDYYGKFGIGPECETNVIPYVRYDFTLGADASLDNIESPTQVTYTTTVTKTGSTDVDSDITRTFTKKRAGVHTALIPGSATSTDSYATPSPKVVTDLVPPGAFQRGDSYCIVSVMARGHGWRGPSTATQEYANESAAQDDNTCNAVVNDRPYFKAYGSDVVAGGGFGANCARSDEKILGYLFALSSQIPGGKSGSGSQLALMALGSIEGVTSASSRGVAPTSPNGLTFSNDGFTTPSLTTNRPALGGNLEGDGACIPDYFGQTQYSDATVKTTLGPTINLNVASTANYKQTLINSGGALTHINGQAVGFQNYDKHHTIYVDGDVSITGNIRYKASGYTSIVDIPSFTLVVRGNIYIDKDTEYLDGLYIAQPLVDGTKGKIYTCSDGDAPVTDATQLFAVCGANGANKRQLYVNGGFVAQKIVLNRTGYSLRDSGYREDASATKASEIFNFSPEMYLSPPFFSPRSTSTSGEYQYIVTLPPVL